MTFGEKVGQLRKRLKWSQDELAKRIGTSGAIVGRYEREEIKPSVEVAAKIADALEVTIDYLTGRTEKIILDKKMLKRLESIENLPKDDKEKIFYFIDVVIRDAKTRQAYSS